MTEQAPAPKAGGSPGTEEFPSGEVAMRAKKKPKPQRRFRRKRKVVK